MDCVSSPDFEMTRFINLWINIFIQCQEVFDTYCQLLAETKSAKIRDFQGVCVSVSVICLV